MFISSWKHKGGTIISIENFRKMMDVVNKHERFSDLMRRVILPAQEVLKNTSDCWFEISPQKRDGEKQPFQLSFKIISIPLNAFEKNKFESQKKMIEGVFWQLGMKQGHIEEILNQIHVGNVINAIQKSYDLQQTDFDRELVKPDAYYFKAMMDFLSEKN